MAGTRYENSGLVDVDIKGLASDSRAVKPQFLFAALPGASPDSPLDGRNFIDDAISRGAIAVLAPPGTVLKKRESKQNAPKKRGLTQEARRKISERSNDPSIPQVQLLTDENPRRRFSLMAARYHAPQPETVVAVTGTNGKSSVVSLARQIWRKLDCHAASIGTIGVETSDDSPTAPGLTTPDPVHLHGTMAGLARAGVTHLALEASSHGLDQYRLDGVMLRAAAFTSFGRDHLDYHLDSDSYFNAKARLFTDILPKGGTAVLNADTPEYERLLELCRASGHRVRSFGRDSDDIKILDIAPEPDGQALRFSIGANRHTVPLNLVGSFQAYNLLAALGLVLACGTDEEAAISTLSSVQGVRGRMEFVAKHPQTGAPIFIDYAHTPDALEVALSAIRPHCRNFLTIVFGAGGDRDAGKRPLMGEVCNRLADRVYVTDDNPRTENPADIRAEVLAGCPCAIEIGDREEAIRRAIANLESDDLLVIAGKGHETGQIIGDQIIPFDDRAIARQVVEALRMTPDAGSTV